MDTSKMVDNQIPTDRPDDLKGLTDLKLDRLYSAWKEDRHSSSPETLREWTARYPAYGSELTEWAATAPVVQCEEDLAGPQIDRAEARTRDIGRNVVAARRARYSVAAMPAFADIYTAARDRGLNPRTLAAKLGVGLAIVAKLQQRLIGFGTIPTAFIDRLSQELQVTAQQVSDYLRQPASLAAGASYKSNGVPQAATQENFNRAIDSCAEMTAEQKQVWQSDTIGEQIQ